MVTDMLNRGFIVAARPSICWLMVAIGLAIPRPGNGQVSPALLPRQSEEPVEWLTGNERQVQLQRTIRTTWTAISLDAVLQQIARTQRICIWLDRRIDKGQSIQLDSGESRSVFSTLQEVLGQCNLSGFWIDDIYYIGDLEQVAALVSSRQRAANALRSAPEISRKAWLARKPFAWPRLTRPAELLQREFPDLGAEGGGLPHDLWPAFSGPPLSRLDLLLVIATGFGMEPALDPSAAAAVTLIPIRSIAPAEPVEVSITLPRDLPDGQKQLLASVKAQFPDIEIRVSARTWTIAAPAVDVVRAMQLMDQTAYAAPPGETLDPDVKKVITLKQQASIGQILATAAKNLGVELQFAQEIRPILETRIEINVRRVTYEDLIRQALAGTGLDFELDNGALRVFAK
jgi:hypothetical protein